MLRYQRACYTKAGRIVALHNGSIVKEWEDAVGIWQGGPLGNASFCLSIWDWLSALYARLMPQSALTCDSHGGLEVSIVDDLTVVLRRRDVVSFATWMLREAPNYGVKIALNKWHAYIVRHPSEDPAGSPDLMRTLAMMGCSASCDGLPRLLGAPIGTPAFCTKADGHVSSMVKAAVSFVHKIGCLSHATAEYQMLRYCASVQLHHLPRLLAPHVLAGHASAHRDAIHEGLRSVLNAEIFTEQQRVQIGLSEREGGMSLVTAHDVLLPAYVGGSAAVALFYKKCGWSEAQVLYNVLKSQPALVSAVEELNELFDLNKKRVSVPHLDHDVPHAWPKQSQLTKALHRVRADDLEAQLVRIDAAAASWFASCRLHGSGAWLHSSPKIALFRVSSQLYRVMLSMRLMAKMPSTELVTRCVCGATGPQIKFGVHWFSSCRCCSFKSTRHDKTVEVMAEMCTRINRQVREGESACWIRGRRDLRPFDLLTRPYSDLSSPWQGYDVTVADPTRVGLVPSGSRYFKSGKPSSRLVNRKKNHFKRLVQEHGLTHPAEFAAIGFEVTGGIGSHASSWLKEVCSVAQELGAGAPESNWTANNFSAYYTQLLSFNLVKFTALGVMNGIRRSIAETLAQA
jgi:hypothetical protein